MNSFLICALVVITNNLFAQNLLSFVSLTDSKILNFIECENKITCREIKLFQKFLHKMYSEGLKVEAFENPLTLITPSGKRQYLLANKSPQKLKEAVNYCKKWFKKFQSLPRFQTSEFVKYKVELTNKLDETRSSLENTLKKPNVLTVNQ